MKKLLVVDDDAAMRGLIRMRLAEQYEVFDTGDPEQALALALEHKPMPFCSIFGCPSSRDLSCAIASTP